MSIETTLARVDAIRQAIADPARLAGAAPGPTGGTEAPAGTASGSPFAVALAQASAGYSAAPAAAALELPAGALTAPGSAGAELPARPVGA